MNSYNCSKTTTEKKNNRLYCFEIIGENKSPAFLGSFGVGSECIMKALNPVLLWLIRSQPEISGKNYNFPITCHIGDFYLCILFQLQPSCEYIQPICTALQYKLYKNMPEIKSKQLLEKIIVLNSAPRCLTQVFINIYGSF